MDINKIKQAKRIRRKGRVRAKVSGTAQCPRLTVFRSNRGIYAQIINDEIGKTMVSVSANEVRSDKSPRKPGAEQINGVKTKGLPTGQAGNKIVASSKLGKLIAEKALAKGISQVVFDRSGYKYHGRIKALAEGARLGGLKF